MTARRIGSKHPPGPTSPGAAAPPGAPHSGRSDRSVPAGVWVLGLVSLLMDSSSELIHSLLPILMADVLGASMVTIGLIEGAAEGAAALTKVVSGALSDRLGRRKGLAVVGYGLSALTKPVFPLATTIGWVFGARFADRIGKGIRGAPRDALVADITPPRLRGAAYGLRQALDSVGAFVGPLLAVAFMAWLADDIEAVLWVGVVPAFLAVALLVVGVREPREPPEPPEPSKPEAGPAAEAPPVARTAPRAAGGGALAGLRRLPRAFWPVVALGAVFTLARFSEAFLVLRAQNVGVALGRVPVVLVVMNVVYALASYPAGRAADRLARRPLLVAGLVVLIAADVVLALALSPAAVFAGAALWGLHMALTQGLLAKLVADAVPAGLRGTAFGIFNVVGGGALILASVLAGALWNAYGAPATFAAGAGFAALAVLGLLSVRPVRPSRAGGEATG